jgi:hypothetical protein
MLIVSASAKGSQRFTRDDVTAWCDCSPDGIENIERKGLLKAAPSGAEGWRGSESCDRLSCLTTRKWLRGIAEWSACRRRGSGRSDLPGPFLNSGRTLVGNPYGERMPDAVEAGGIVRPLRITEIKRSVGESAGLQNEPRGIDRAGAGGYSNRNIGGSRDRKTEPVSPYPERDTATLDGGIPQHSRATSIR